MDPIHPITPGPPTISPATDRRWTGSSESRARATGPPRTRSSASVESLRPRIPLEDGEDGGPDDGGRPHIDVRV